MFYNEKIFRRCFDYKGRYWYRNIKHILLYFKLMHHLIKYGYDEYATWETFNWFIDTMKSILTAYSTGRNGTPILADKFPNGCNLTEEELEQNQKMWDSIINRMIELLDLMDESNPKYEGDEYKKGWERQDKEMNEAKNEFFNLFSEHFYRLWD